MADGTQAVGGEDAAFLALLARPQIFARLEDLLAQPRKRRGAPLETPPRKKPAGDAKSHADSRVGASDSEDDDDDDDGDANSTGVVEAPKELDDSDERRQISMGGAPWHITLPAVSKLLKETTGHYMTKTNRRLVLRRPDLEALKTPLVDPLLMARIQPPQKKKFLKADKPWRTLHEDLLDAVMGLLANVVEQLLLGPSHAGDGLTPAAPLHGELRHVACTSAVSAPEFWAMLRRGYERRDQVLAHTEWPQLARQVYGTRRRQV